MGGDFQFVDIIFFAMIAAFLVIRLRGVLGRRDGFDNHDGDKQNLFNHSKSSKDDDDTDTENVIKLPDQETQANSEAEVVEDPLAKGLAEIGNRDPDFSAKELISGACMAFEMILGAYASGDREALEPLLSDEVYGNFVKSINDRKESEETLEYTMIGIKNAEIVEAYMEDSMAYVTVKFVSDQINATRDGNGDVISGNPDMIVKVTDFWTFSRDPNSRNPNWTLVATRSLD